MKSKKLKSTKKYKTLPKKKTKEIMKNVLEQFGIFNAEITVEDPKNKE